VACSNDHDLKIGGMESRYLLRYQCSPFFDSHDYKSAVVTAWYESTGYIGPTRGPAVQLKLPKLDLMSRGYVFFPWSCLVSAAAVRGPELFSPNALRRRGRPKSM
jgi:hypothetical protein